MWRVARRLRLELAALLDAESVLLVDDDQAERGERDRLLDERVRADDHGRLARGEERLDLALGLGVERAREQDDANAEIGEEIADGVAMLAGEQIGRCQERRLEPGARGRGQGVRGNGRLARTDVALEEAQHRCRAGYVGAHGVDRGRLVGGQFHIGSHAPAKRRDDGGAKLAVDVMGYRHRARRGDPALPPPPHHPDLQCEQLVEREPLERGVAILERRRVVRLLECAADGRQRFVGPDRLGQVFRVMDAGLVQRLAHSGSEARGGQARGQPIDRDDATDMQEIGVVRVVLELRIVEGQLAAEPLEPATDDDLIVRL